MGYYEEKGKVQDIMRERGSMGIMIKERVKYRIL